jgi:hypothetical protein
VLIAVLLSYPAAARDISTAPNLSAARIRNIRLEAPTRPIASPSAVLKFEVFNQGSKRLTHVEVQISFLENSTEDDTPPRVIIGPFTVRGKVDLDAGYSLQYELLLRNVTIECGCVAKVTVVSAD